VKKLKISWNLLTICNSKAKKKNRQYLQMDQLLKYSQQFREYLMAVNQDLQE